MFGKFGILIDPFSRIPHRPGEELVGRGLLPVDDAAKGDVRGDRRHSLRILVIPSRKLRVVFPMFQRCWSLGCSRLLSRSFISSSIEGRCSRTLSERKRRILGFPIGVLLGFYE